MLICPWGSSAFHLYFISGDSSQFRRLRYAQGDLHANYQPHSNNSYARFLSAPLSYFTDVQKATGLPLIWSVTSRRTSGGGVYLAACVDQDTVSIWAAALNMEKLTQLKLE